jgi:hypothetical protein
MTALALGLLRSYEQMGTAVISCVSGCTCVKHSVDLSHTEHTSPVEMHWMLVSQSQECVLRIEVGGQPGPTGGHKVRPALHPLYPCHSSKTPPTYHPRIFPCLSGAQVKVVGLAITPAPPNADDTALSLEKSYLDRIAANAVI